MQRILNNYNNGFDEENESILKSDFNWNELSIGNESTSVDRFFGFRHPEHERLNNMNRIIFEDTAMEEDRMKENEQKNDSTTQVNNILDNLSSSLDDVYIGVEKKEKAQLPNLGTSNAVKPLATQNRLVPNAYACIALAEQRRKYRELQLLKKEKEQRKFHAKPAPDFNAIHAIQSQKREKEELKYTIPVTPQVVYNHRKNLIKVEQKRLEYEEMNKRKNFVSKQADVLLKPAFVPKISKKSPIKSAPFNLQSEERVRDRHQFNQQVKMKKEQEEKEAEERRKLEDEEVRRCIRKATTFKANPNPFR